jgi:hypothetical protein
MGLALGGIAAPLPIKRWGFCGAPTNSVTFNIGGQSIGKIIKVVTNVKTTAAANIGITINDGAAHTLSPLVGVLSGLLLTYFASNGNQHVQYITGIDAGADAINFENITTVVITNSSGNIYGASVEILDAKP